MSSIFHLVGLFWPLLIFAIILVSLSFILPLLLRSRESRNKNPFERKPFVFDAMSELTLYRLLLELFGDTYYIFPQMSYGRLVQVKKGEDRMYRNRFDKKIADFVLCDKEKAVAKLVIELDGASHKSEKRIERDERVDAMMQSIGLPILHLKTGDLDKQFIKEEVERVLQNK